MANTLECISMKLHSKKVSLSLALIVFGLLAGCALEPSEGIVEPPAPTVVPSSTSEEPSAVNGPRISFDHDSADLGTLPLNQMFHYYFPFRNVGNAPLEIIGEPTIETLEGC